MEILVLGGTAQLGHAVAAAAVRRGHRVTCAARGVSGSVPAGAELVPVDRRDGLDPLAGRRFDAVVDVATMSLRWVRDALAALGAQAGHWTFVSSINAYADTMTPGQTAASPVLDPVTDAPDFTSEDRQVDVETYGGVKVASENAVREAVGDRAFVVRPGLITGPGDRMDRFGYWAARLWRGGRVLVPDAPDQPIQHIDVLDLAEWIIGSAEQGRTGTLDAIGPVTTLRALLTGLAEIVAPEGTELVAAPPRALLDAGVSPWGGPKSLPLWLPDTHLGLTAHDPAESLAAGMPVRPLAETAHAALRTERELGLDRERIAGLTPAEESELLATLAHRVW
ncbi:NAD-dependent epimerase/dehydratase family protein [Saccharopolyspora rosea]|uniref:NAD-dependent epimerase/dehydratase family protein n=1 Tax=Saccharopolyspora rosea TaxID=524884 RepID=UPI0021D81143|nr:NAD-dependent epimerase/dehydratase family protein [Saccharopolyspora rosea]